MAEPHSPEGVPADATVRLDDGCGSPPSPDVIINVGADTTLAFAAWAMGSDGVGGGGDAAGCAPAGGAPPPLPSIQEEPDVGDGCASPEVVRAEAAAGLVTPSREITPELRRRSVRAHHLTLLAACGFEATLKNCKHSRSLQVQPCQNEKTGHAIAIIMMPDQPAVGLVASHVGDGCAWTL